MIAQLTLGLSVAFAGALSPAGKERFAAALAAESEGRWSQAAAHYGVILAVDSDHEASVLGLGRALEAQGDTETALRTYERLGSNPKGIEARAFLLEPIDPLRAAELYRLQQALQLGDPWPYLGEARALKRVDASGAASAVDGYLDLVQEPPKGTVILDVIGALRAGGEDALAEQLMERILREWPSVDWADEVQSRLDRLRIERSALDFAVAEPTPLSSTEQAALNGARRLAAAGRPDEAISKLAELVRLVPGNAEPWGELGALHRAQGDVAEAEVAYIRAISAAPQVAAWHRRFGDLLIEAYGGKRDREARDAYRTALSLRPTWTEVAYSLAETERALREYDAALEAYRTVIELDPNGGMGRKAQRRIQQLGRKAPDIAVTGPADRGLSGVDPKAVEHFRLARAYRANDRIDDAIVEVLRACELAPQWSGALNLLAALHVAGGQREKGRDAWYRSLELNAKQPNVLLALAELAAGDGDAKAAKMAYAEASDLGSAEALYRMAELSHSQGDSEGARLYLQRFFDQTTGGPKHAPAVALSSTLDAELLRQRSVFAAIAAVLVVMVGVVGWRRARRKTVNELIERVPGVAHDVSLVVSAIRHELLKHNTSLLNEMAVALEEGDDQAVVYGAERLFGLTGQESVTSRYDEYLDQLVTLGRTHGLALDVRHSDPVFGPISRSMSALYRIRRKLQVPPANRTARLGLAGTVSAIAHALNVDAYHQLGVMLTTLSTCRLDRDLVDRVNKRVCSEPGFVEVDIPPISVSIPDEPSRVAASRGDLEDVLTNLIRNALQAVVDGGALVDASVGVSVVHQTDEITGLLRVEIAVRDTAPGHLTTAMIMEAEMGRGLALVRDLIERNGGTVRVQLMDDGSKSVLVELERVDEQVAR